MKLESEEYPFCQLNETINLSPDGKVLSKSLMINLRNRKPEVVHKNYLKLKQLIEGKEDEQETKVKDNPEKEKKQIKQKKDENVCPQCGSVLIEKSGISKKSGIAFHFWGCSKFPACNFTKSFLTKAEKQAPADEDLIAVLR
ncbi:topoisomerase DNA-binding C4 zinc finger domain-containing protein [Candidatus Parcubacteria bacterium]|nr:topoisomerase DNA-binding C4 zinc finger domain-containing protein [Candidatus Parcubacteria bacterium]